jgi:hypothetical protein
LFPEPPDSYFTVGPSFSSILLNTSSDRAGSVFRIPKAGNVRKIGFATRTVTTGATVDVRLETVDLATGTPSGTLWGTNTNGSQVINSSDDNVWLTTTLTADAAVSMGDLIALSINNAGSGNWNLAASADWADARGVYNLRFTSSAWTKQASQAPILALEYDDGSYFPIEGVFPYVALTHTSFGSTSSPDERGLRFKFPFPVRVRGCWAYIDPDNDFRIKLYDTDGSSTLINILIDKDALGSNAEAFFAFTFTSIVELQRDNYYRLSVVPESATTMELGGVTVNSLALMDALKSGPNFHLTTRTDAGSWSETTTQRPYMGVILDAFDDGVGNIVIPRRGGVLCKM